MAVLLLMQSRGRVTAAEIAAEMEVSVATARRDLEALSAAGVPVYPQAGRGGGWALLGGARTDLSGLKASEARALFLLLGPAAAIAPEAKAALRKLVRALPSTFRQEAEAAADAVVVDPARWGEHRRTRPVLVDLLEDAVVRRRKARLTYSGRERVVAPFGLVDKDDTWYLIAGTPDGQRTFRVDRVTDAEVTEEPAERPTHFDLAAAWDEVVTAMEARRATTTATATVDARHLPVLRDYFGRHCEVISQGERVRVTLTAPTALDIARQLAGWGDLVIVEGPQTVRDELAKLAAQLTTLYGRQDQGQWPSPPTPPARRSRH
ncbi:Predicted DNA-binding transcriptional regulator YafY, contains an HTH and WYL domains [Thermomonospora echinospora]|uniref:Predicted DNA-binding transcriptional regulator YafY, contains an HTH and WYL domains n=1 Tax=Thermomonospora echinospora TaxID=1992 RepID=A0A1H6DPI4_9ACTN|nr:Predicted DNA-binding transcriptional regulator YafY, contains an HTH and WYL domains [Thermomonospora echinospora]